MAKLVVISGSPRKGSNSETLAMKIAEGAKTKGYEIELFNINEMKNKKGCQGCDACKKTGKCVQKDDIAKAIDAVEASNAIILATPIYFGQSTAQFKLFEDRMYKFFDPSGKFGFPKGKKVAIVCTCGSGLDGAKAVAAQLEGVFGMFGSECVGKIVEGGALAPGFFADNAKVLDAAVELGKKF